MAKIKRTSANIYIDGAPEGITQEQKTFFANQVQETLGSFTGSYEEAQNAINTAAQNSVNDGDKLKAAEQDISPVPAYKSREEILLENQANIDNGTAPETTAGGVLGSVTREGGGPLAAAATGAVLGSVVPGVGTLTGAGAGFASYGITKIITPAVKKLVERLGGTAIDMQELETAIADNLGLEKPDTPAEELAGATTQGVVDAATQVATGNLIGTTGKLLQGAQKLQGVNVNTLSKLNPANIAQMMQRGGGAISDQPIKQLIGGLGGGFGAEKGQQYAENQGWGETGQMTMSLFGGILGDMTTTGVSNIVESANDFLRKAPRMEMPEAIDKAIKASYNRGDIRYTDTTPRTDAEADLMDWMKSVGKNDVATNLERTGLLKEFAVNAGVTSPDYYSREITEDFWNKRIGTVNDLKGGIKDIYSRLSQGRTPKVKVGNTVDAIDAEIARLTNLGSNKYAAIRDRLPVWKEAVLTGNEQLLREEMHGLSTMEVPGINKVGDILESWANDLANNKQPIDFYRQFTEIASTGANAYKPIISELTDWREIAQGKNLVELESIRKNWGETFKGDTFKPIKGEGDAAYKSIYGALKDEVGEHIMNTGTRADYVQWQNSNVRLSNMAEEFKKGALKAFLNDEGSDPSLIMQFIRSEDQEIIGKVYKGLTPYGQGRLRAAIVADGINAAVIKGSGGELSANQFSDYLRAHAAQKGILMTSDDTSQVEGLTRWFDRTSGAESTTIARDTLPGKSIPGSRYAWARVIMGNPAVGIPLVAGGTVAGKQIVNAMESPPIRDMLIKYGELPERELAAGAGGELFKRISEALRGYANTQQRRDEREAEVGDASIPYSAAEARERGEQILKYGEK